MLAALAGGAALMGRGKKKFGTDAGFFKIWSSRWC